MCFASACIYFFSIHKPGWLCEELVSLAISQTRLSCRRVTLIHKTAGNYTCVTIKRNEDVCVQKGSHPNCSHLFFARQNRSAGSNRGLEGSDTSLPHTNSLKLTQRSGGVIQDGYCVIEPLVLAKRLMQYSWKQFFFYVSHFPILSSSLPPHISLFCPTHSHFSRYI